MKTYLATFLVVLAVVLGGKLFIDRQRQEEETFRKAVAPFSQAVNELGRLAESWPY
jgi:hypothetical protein